MEEEEVVGDVTAVSRLETPISISDVMSKCTDFVISTDDIDNQNEEETHVTQVYDYEKLEPFCRYENLEVDSDNEAGDPSQAFPTYRKQMHCVGNDNKLMKKLVQCGFGDVVGDHPKIITYVHYAAYVELAEYPFDASRLRRKQPIPLRLGVDSVVPGMELAIRTMKKGEKSKFLVHPSLAFGEKGVPPRIPPNATILYEIELLDFSQNNVMNVNMKDDEEDIVKTFEEKLVIAKQLHNEGNTLKKWQKNVNGAIAAYRKALSLLLQAHYKNQEEEDMAKQEMMKLYTNLAVCYMNKNLYKKVCIAYNEAMHDCPELARKNAKILYNSAKALRFLGDFNEACNRLKKALKLKPNDDSILSELKILDTCKVQHRDFERNSCRRMFGFSQFEENSENSSDNMVDVVNEEFIHLFRQQLEEFLESAEDSCKLQFGATVNEKEFCRRECVKLNLSFRETKSDNLPVFTISKKLGD